MAGLAWRGLAELGMARPGEFRIGRQGLAGLGLAWHGRARLGKAGMDSFC